MSVVTCLEDCDFNLPATSFAECNPEVNLSQIAKIYVAKPEAASFSDPYDITEWNTRLSETANDADSIRPLTVIGDKPLPEKTEKTISGNRIVVTDKKHTLNFDIDESNAINHEFVRGSKCIKSVKFWYETIGGKLFGGPDGINGTIAVDMTLGRADGDIILYQGTLKWSDTNTEEMGDSPLA